MPTEEFSDYLQGLRIIVVEDSYVVAKSLTYLLSSYGCVLVGLAGDVEASLALTARSDFDVALLDIRLGSELVTAVADRVHEQDKDIIFLTGYADSDLLPDHLRDYPCLHKPVEPKLLIETLGRMLEEKNRREPGSEAPARGARKTKPD
jgi:DNA-binding NtrC family response regulator